MYKTGIGMFLVLFCLSGCKSRNEAITESQIKAKVDSLVAIKMEEINRQAMEDLDRRMTIEVKAKADSIVQARMKQEGTAPVAQH